MLLDLCKKIGFDIPSVLWAKHVSKFKSMAFVAVYLCLGCEIAQYGVSILHCDMHVMCVGFVSIVLLFSLFRFIVLPVFW